MRIILRPRFYLVVLLTYLIPSFLAAQQSPTIQELQSLFDEERNKNIFLHVSAQQLWQASNGTQPFKVEEYCALEENAGVMKYGPVTKERDSAIAVLNGDVITWAGKVDPFSRSEYEISIKQIVVREIIGENIFYSVYLPGENEKVITPIKENTKIHPSEVRYDIVFELSLKKSNIVKLFTLDPWIIVR